MRHFNSIIASLEDEPPDVFPIWSAIEFEGREWDDAEAWALGFVQGVDLCRADWQPLLETEQGRAWYRPIGLLGEEDFCPEQDELRIRGSSGHGHSRHSLFANSEFSAGPGDWPATRATSLRRLPTAT